MSKKFIEGKRLIQAKKLVAHGAWKSWLEENFNLSMQTARKFMQVFERFGITRDVARFQPSQLIELLSLPTGEEQNFLALKSAEGKPVEDMTVKALRAEIADYK